MVSLRMMCPPTARTQIIWIPVVLCLLQCLVFHQTFPLVVCPNHDPVRQVLVTLLSSCKRLLRLRFRHPASHSHLPTVDLLLLSLPLLFLLHFRYPESRSHLPTVDLLLLVRPDPGRGWFHAQCPPAGEPAAVSTAPFSTPSVLLLHYQP